MTLQYINVRLLVSFALPGAFENLDFVVCGSQKLIVFEGVTWIACRSNSEGDSS
jgi:hypothetical protein